MTGDALPESPPSLVRHRRPFLAPLWLLGWLALIVLIVAVIYWKSATTTTIVVLRHAEKQVGAISDSPLSPTGEQRAARLALLFGDAEKFGRIEKIYVTNTRRTQQTAAELGQRIGVTPEIVDAQLSAPELASKVLKENRGGRALVVGHSNTVPDIVRALTKADHVPLYADEEFDTMYIVTVPTIGRASVLRLKY
jgi:broad specificity phosphatase PhoE